MGRVENGVAGLAGLVVVGRWLPDEMIDGDAENRPCKIIPSYATTANRK